MQTPVLLRKYGHLVLLLLLLLLGSGITYFVSARLFTIQTIEVVGNGVSVAIDQERLPKNLLFFPSDAIVKDILADNQLVEGVEIRKKFPHTLIIIARGRQAIARIFFGGRQWGIDQTGIVVGEIIGFSSLPVVDIAVQSVEAGQQIAGGKVVEMLEITKAVQSFLPLVSLVATESSSILARTDKTDIFIAQGFDAKTISATLQTLFEGFRIKGTLPTVIDLRFNRPVVKF